MLGRAWSSLLVFVVVVPFAASPLEAQQNAILTHIGHVADAFNGTPEGRGLLATARAEAEIVVRHAELAARDTTNLQSMKQHAAHVMHAVDPTTQESGPGLGYGLKQAAQGVVRHIDMARQDSSASRRVRDYGRRVSYAAQNAVERADSLLVLARGIQQASTASEAAKLVRELQEVASILIPGVDANRDGGVGWRRGEGGLETARQNLVVLQQEARAAADSARNRRQQTDDPN